MWEIKTAQECLIVVILLFYCSEIYLAPIVSFGFIASVDKQDLNNLCLGYLKEHPINKLVILIKDIIQFFIFGFELGTKGLKDIWHDLLQVILQWTWQRRLYIMIHMQLILHNV